MLETLGPKKELTGGGEKGEKSCCFDFKNGLAKPKEAGAGGKGKCSKHNCESEGRRPGLAASDPCGRDRPLGMHTGRQGFATPGTQQQG